MKTDTRSQRSEVCGQRPISRRILDCGGKQSPTPLPDSNPVGKARLSARAVTTSPDAAAHGARRPIGKFWLLLQLLLSTLNSQLSTAHAQSYSIGWFKIAGGGGTSTGGVYSVSGTIGQHDASGPLTNGPYSLIGGFWALPTLVQTPGAPTLHITNAAPGFATLWWTPPTPGFTLQSTDSLSPTNWVNAPTGPTNPATVPATLPAQFYRLFKP